MTEEQIIGFLKQAEGRRGDPGKPLIAAPWPAASTGWIGDFSVSDTLGGKNVAMLVPAA